MIMNPTSPRHIPSMWAPSDFCSSNSLIGLTGVDITEDIGEHVLNEYVVEDDVAGESSGTESPIQSSYQSSNMSGSSGIAVHRPVIGDLTKNTLIRAGSTGATIWKQAQVSVGPHHGLWSSTSTTTTATSNSSSWPSWNEQKESTSQHSRGSTSIWGATGDDYSATSQGVASINSMGGGLSQLSVQDEVDPLLGGAGLLHDDVNSFDENSYALDSNIVDATMASLILNHRLGGNVNSYQSINNNVAPPGSMLCRASTDSSFDRYYTGRTGGDVQPTSRLSAFQSRNQGPPTSPAPNQSAFYPMSAAPALASGIPGLIGTSGSTNSSINSSVSGSFTSQTSSKLNPRMGSWRPSSAPVGTPKKVLTAGGVAGDYRGRTGSPPGLSSLISAPPLFQSDRSSPTIFVGSGVPRHTSRNSTGGSSSRGAVTGGRDRQRFSNSRKKQQYTSQQLGNVRQNHHASPQALKEVNNFKKDLSESSYYGATANMLMSPVHMRHGSVGSSMLREMTSPSASLMGTLPCSIPMSPATVAGSSEALRALMRPHPTPVGTPLRSVSLGALPDPLDQSTNSYATNYDMDRSMTNYNETDRLDSYPILPQLTVTLEELYPSYFGEDISEEASDFDDEDEDDTFRFEDYDIVLDDEETGETESRDSTANGNVSSGLPPNTSTRSKKRDWLLRMNRKLHEIPVGELDPAVMPLSAIMNAWAKTKSSQGASMVETWLTRAQEEYNAGNRSVVPTTKMYTMAVDAWARSGEGGAAAQRAEALLQHMHQLYQSGGHEELRPTNAIFNAVINAWARSREKLAPVRAEQILNWMQNLSADLDIQPDKYTFNTVIHAWAKAGGTEAATKAQELLARMHNMYQEGNVLAKPDTISYNVVINAWAKSGGKGAANEAEKLLLRMHRLHEMGDPDVKPNVVTYGAVIDSFAKSGERGAASRADTLLANMIQLHQSDPMKHADLLPNTYVFNTVINCWAKSKEHDAASKAEEMLVAMSKLHASGMPTLKPDNFTYTAVIDAWAKSGYKGAASRADQLLDKMEAKYLAGDNDLKPNSYTYNAVICALAKSGEPGAANRAERVLHNMVNRHRSGGDEDIKPTTINFNTVLDAWAKSRGGRAAAERAEEILEWMDKLHKCGNQDVKVDTISFNAVLDAWARSGDRVAPRRAEQILEHMDGLYRSGNKGVKPDRYTYNTLINVWAKSGEKGSALRAENVLMTMEKRHRDGDQDFKPNTRTYTSVIDALAKSGESGAARRAEQILNNMISRYEAAGDPDVKPNVHTANAVCNACAFSKDDEDREEALQIAFRIYDWLANQSEMSPDSYTYTILLSVCSNLLPREDAATRYAHARAFFESCCDAGYVNDYVLKKLRQTVTDSEFMELTEHRADASASNVPVHWTRNAKFENQNSNGKMGGRKGGNWNNNRRKGK